MKLHKLADMPNGALIGAFDSAVLQTKDFEMSLERLVKGDTPEPHFHALTSKVGLVVDGVMIVNGETLQAGDIFFVPALEVVRMECLEDANLVIVRSPAVVGDTYPASLRE